MIYIYIHLCYHQQMIYIYIYLCCHQQTIYICIHMLSLTDDLHLYTHLYTNRDDLQVYTHTLPPTEMIYMNIYLYKPFRSIITLCESWRKCHRRCTQKENTLSTYVIYILRTLTQSICYKYGPVRLY